MNSTTAGQVRKLKDSGTSAYVWQPALQQGQPDRLMGYPVVVVEAMPDPIGGAVPIAFGDWRRAYFLCDRTGLRITVDNNITEPGKIKYFARRRVYGQVANNDAAKVLKLL